MRFYHRTSRNHGYSNGIFIEALRGIWTWIAILFIPALIIATLRGQLTFSLVLIVAAGAGYCYLTRRR